MEFDMTTLAGIAAATMILLEAMKSISGVKEWLKGKEEASAIVIPLVLGVLSKLSGAFAAMTWPQLVVSLVAVGLGAQLGHDKILKPLVKKEKEKEEDKDKS